MLFQFLPRLADDEYAALEKSIRENGVMVPIVVDEKRSIIDGHHRKEIADRLGIDCPKKHVWDLADDQKRTLALSLNLDRRHLSREQKREVLTKSLTADPRLSDREHAKRVGVSPSTVGALRSSLEEDGQLSKLDTRVSADGRERPATQPERPVPAVNTETGEISDDYLPDAATGEEVTPPVHVEATDIEEEAPGEEVEPPPTAPSRPADTDWPLKNAEQAAEGVATAVMRLHALTVDSAFQRFVSDEWPRGHRAASPALRDRMTPQHFREIARALNRLADQWEGTPA